MNVFVTDHLLEKGREGSVIADGRPIIDVRGLTTSFYVDGHWLDALKQVSFTVARGETVAIVGESGSGKSVTALSIMQLISRANGRISGEVLLDGENLIGLPEFRMTKIRGKDISMVFQEPMSSLNPVLSIGDQIAEALILHGHSHQDSRIEAIRLLDRVRISGAAQRYREYPHQLSGGMRQRVMIAMALACRPKLLIADEPTTALDVTIQAEILVLIKELQQEVDTSVLFITHDMGVVAEIADRTLVMLNGAIVEASDTASLFAQPSHVYTRRLLASVPRLGALQGFRFPARFPKVDPVSGTVGPTIESADTVMRGNPPLLEVKNLAARFNTTKRLFAGTAGRVHAVEDVSFRIDKGETLSLVGESGSGKSTVGRAIVGLVSPHDGSIRIDGRELLGKSGRKAAPLRQHVQMIFQDPYGSLNPRMTIGAAIAEPILVHKLAPSSDARERVADLLVKVGLSADMARRYPHEFSGGQRQRICIARALALEPRLIIADEVVSALDVSIKAQVVNLLLDLQETLKISFLFISHDIAIVERVSHRVAVMYCGEIVEIGLRADILGNPQHPYTRRLLSAVPAPYPGQRRKTALVQFSETPTVIRQVGYVPPNRRYREVGPGHFVHEIEA